MRLIYHLVTPAAWQAADPVRYEASSLATEGFIHCSNRGQVAWAANRFYREEPELLMLGIEVDRLGSAVRDEDGGNGQLFPHVYGPIERQAVTSITPLARGPDGSWQLAD